VGGVFSQSSATPALGGFEATDAFFKDLNARGGVNGYTFDLVTVDDTGDAQQNAAAMQRLIAQDKADIIISIDNGALSGGAATVKQSGIPLVGCTFNPPCYNTPNMFPVGAFLPAVIPASVASLLADEGAKQVAILAVDTPGTLSVAGFARKDFGDKNIRITFDTTYAPTESDFTGLVARLMSSGAKDVFLVGTNPTIPPFMAAAEQQGFNGQVYSSVFNTALPGQIGAYANDRLHAVTAVAPLGAGDVGDVAAAAVKKYHSNIDPRGLNFAAIGWTSGEVVAAAVKALGDKPPSRENLLAALDGLTALKTTFGAPLTYGVGPHRDPANCGQIQVVRGGAWAIGTKDRFQCWTGSVAPPAG
jgi:branched-chain amino acid transport system substrate-binding protein